MSQKQSKKSSEPAQKILRIGVIQAGKIVEERLVRNRESVTIGASPRNAIVVPASSLPRSFSLFEMSGNRYYLVFSDTMDGRVSAEGKVLSLEQVRQQGLAKPGKGNLLRLPLTEASRGKVILGEITLLFQFVAPPPVQPRPQLPPSVRGSFFTNMDWGLATSYAGTTVFVMAFMVYLNNKEFAAHIEPDVIPDNFAEYMPAVQKPEEKVDLTKVADVGEKKVKKKKKAKKEKKQAKKAPAKKAPACDEACQAQRAAERRAKLAEQVAKMGALKLLGTQGEGKGATANLLQGGDPGADANKAFQNVGGLSVAKGGKGLKGNGDGGPGSRVDIGNLGGRVSGPGGVNTGKMVKEKVPKALVKQSKPEVEGTLKADAVARVIRRGLPAVKSCYQRALKRNPSLSGKITIRVIISATGRVTEVEFDTDTIGDPQVASCIRGYAKRWRFAPPEGGDVAEVAVPLVFQAAN